LSIFVRLSVRRLFVFLILHRLSVALVLVLILRRLVVRRLALANATSTAVLVVVNGVACVFAVALVCVLPFGRAPLGCAVVRGRPRSWQRGRGRPRSWQRG